MSKINILYILFVLKNQNKKNNIKIDLFYSCIYFEKKKQLKYFYKS